VRFFLTGVAETAAKGRDVFSAILKLRQEVEHQSAGLGKRSALARSALQFLYRKPFVTAGQLESALSVSTPTANALIRDFLRLRILVEISGQQRGRVYLFERYLKLFIS
jgi:Fic family protein